VTAEWYACWKPSTKKFVSVLSRAKKSTAKAYMSCSQDKQRRKYRIFARDACTEDVDGHNIVIDLYETSSIAVVTGYLSLLEEWKRSRPSRLSYAGR
jgi:hypothetical protein